MLAAKQVLLPDDEFITFERESREKHELVNGEVFAMAGASPRHNAIAANLTALLGVAFKRKPCIVFTSDQRIHVEATDLYTYADIAVACDKPRFHPRHLDVLLNPRLIVEVLSDSTEAYDRGAKFDHYRAIPSFDEYLLVSQYETWIEHYRRFENDTWLFQSLRGEDAMVELFAASAKLPLSEIYDKVYLLPPDPRTLNRPGRSSSS